MENIELQKHIHFVNSLKMVTQQRIKDLEETQQVQEYQLSLHNKEIYEQYEIYLNSLVIGEDHTLFEPPKEYLDKAHNLYHQSFSKVVGLALEVKKRHQLYPQITFNEIMAYQNCVKNYMHQLYYMKGDRISTHICVLIEPIFENPQNYTFSDLEALRKNFSQETLINNHSIGNYVVYDAKTDTLSQLPDEEGHFATLYSVTDMATSERLLRSYTHQQALETLGIYQLTPKKIVK